MKKLIALLLALVMTLSLVACGGAAEAPATEAPAAEAPAAEAPAAEEAESGLPKTDGTTVYVLGPTPDHGWTAQAGVYAQQACDEITAAGKYKGVYYGANDAEEQVDQINAVIANGDAAAVVLFAMDYGALAGELAVIEEGIPLIQFDRIIEETKGDVILNASGDNWQAGAGIAKYLQECGLNPGDTLVTLYGDNGIVCNDREAGFRQFLMGELDYYDRAEDKTYHTTEVWTKEQLDEAMADYSYVCNWSADASYGYLEQKLEEIVGVAKANTNELYIYSMDDEMTFGMLNLLEGNAISDATKADLEAMNVAISAIGGMEELYQVMRGESSQSPLADQYFDGLMSVFFSPTMMKDVIYRMMDYLEGNWEYEELGAAEYVQVFLVDRENAGDYVGFTGH